MTSQDTQQRPIPNVPEGTPGRDWRADLPAALPQGAQQPWRRHGPGSRTWVAILTAIVLVVMAIAGIFALSFGFATTAFERQGAVVLTPSEYAATSTSCSGARNAAGVKEDARIEFVNGSDTFGASLGKGVLRSGRCVFPFTLSSVHADPDVNYAVTVGDSPATPVSGSELASTSGTLMVYLAD
ncbi:hypothetical protein [Tsukamurella paurometabola]|uniref:Uncharacterized protein n=1 Tax=Tsukamurella paurometabola TaxID=2061 RepID=A0A3P8K4W3_TSUPA|nr:hypothetical protein [Tsukamurella paurometabola]MBS4103721.1 hypothetical protein [Tsukamurella paurometabola]UEA83277.1 hypothetical protein LK411_23510 [Tsukamurella paurometabola]VDR40379.1 Uncharacterised protein [Tsukamurella paurometabola]